MNLSPLNSIKLFVLLLVIPALGFSQAIGTKNAKIQIKGTSNIHDWVMNSSTGICNGTFTVDGAGALTAVSNVNFTVDVKSLKSEKGSTMDNNAYKAMAADKNPTISFSSGSCSVTPNSDKSYTISAPGKLTINGVSKDVTLKAKATVNPDHSVAVSGTQPLVTTDYNVKAISIMLGAIKTSANVTIVYNLLMK
jgi:polyisoprenoid-binding protein YceI